jgi:hypothetical protein
VDEVDTLPVSDLATPALMMLFFGRFVDIGALSQ